MLIDINIIMSNLFSKAFFRTLNEADEIPAADVSQDPAAMSDADAMASTLDQGSAPEDFDVHSGSKEAAMAAAKSHAMMTDMLDNWIVKIAEFTDFINGANPNSVQTVLSKADKETLFGKIKAAEDKKIALVAKELAGLTQMLNLYKSNSDNAQLRGA
jgi:hypothetical protein